MLITFRSHMHKYDVTNMLIIFFWIKLPLKLPNFLTTCVSRGYYHISSLCLVYQIYHIYKGKGSTRLLWYESNSYSQIISEDVDNILCYHVSRLALVYQIYHIYIGKESTRFSLFGCALMAGLEPASASDDSKSRERARVSREKAS